MNLMIRILKNKTPRPLHMHTSNCWIQETSQNLQISEQYRRNELLFLFFNSILRTKILAYKLKGTMRNNIKPNNKYPSRKKKYAGNFIYLQEGRFPAPVGSKKHPKLP